MFEGLKEKTDTKDDTFRFCFQSNQQRAKEIIHTLLELVQCKFGTRYLSKVTVIARLSVKLEHVWKNLDSKAKLKLRPFFYLLFICCSQISLVNGCHHLPGCQTLVYAVLLALKELNRTKRLYSQRVFVF